jgi:hypothetical protein
MRTGSRIAGHFPSDYLQRKSSVISHEGNLDRGAVGRWWFPRPVSVGVTIGNRKDFKNGWETTAIRKLFGIWKTGFIDLIVPEGIGMSYVDPPPPWIELETDWTNPEAYVDGNHT